jgi:hypothetical protein
MSKLMNRSGTAGWHSLRFLFPSTVTYEKAVQEITQRHQSAGGHDNPRTHDAFDIGSVFSKLWRRFGAAMRKRNR